MYQATTPTHTFHLPFETTGISKLVLTYRQSGRAAVTKTVDDVVMLGKTISVTLTQEETNKFTDARPVMAQLRLRIGEKVMASNIIKIDMEEALNREVI